MTPADDRALLEAAAKAAGLRVRWYIKGLVHLDSDGLDAGWWNPLLDDADALRLAVKLRIDVCFASDMLFTQTTLAPTPMFKEQYGGDEMAATRRAIVRAAAALPGVGTVLP